MLRKIVWNMWINSPSTTYIHPDQSENGKEKSNLWKRNDVERKEKKKKREASW